MSRAMSNNLTTKNTKYAKKSFLRRVERRYATFAFYVVVQLR